MVDFFKTHFSKKMIIAMFSVFGFLILLIIFSVGLNISKSNLELQLININSQISDLQMQIDDVTNANDLQKTQIIIEATGLDPTLVKKDSDTAMLFFEDAFTWTSHDEYENMRQKYIDALGEGNSFTTNYLPPDTTIAITDGELSYIDNYSLKAYFDSINVIPLIVAGDTGTVIQYAGFVKYYVVNDESDLADKDALVSSEAIIKFTISGEDVRTVSEVEAWPGFTSTIE